MVRGLEAKVRTVDISDIAMLEAIVEHGSINKASEVLHVTQPTLSKRLSRLEHTLGTQLFLRSSSGLTPTAHTQFIIEQSRPSKTMIGNIERHLELVNALEAGDLRIGVGPIVEQLLLPQVLQRLTQSESSTMNLSIRTEAAEDLRTLVIEGVIDIAVGPFLQGDDDAPYSVYPIASQPLVYAARRDHPLVQKQTAGLALTRDDLKPYPLITPHGPRYITEHADAYGQFDGARIFCDNYSLIIYFIQGSDHITTGPVGVFSHQVEDGTLALIPLMNRVDWHAACIARPENATLPIIKTVNDVFSECELPSPDTR